MEDVNVLALTGPPAAGKSTMVSILRDLGIPCRDTGEAIRVEARDRYDGDDEPDEDYIWNEANLIREEHGPAGPTVLTEDWIKDKRTQGNELLCISSLREQAEVEWLREHVGPTLVVRIDADSHARSERYVEQKLDDDDRVTVDRARVQELREKLYERELREQPYPQHDVQIRNENSTQMRDLWERLDNLTTVLGS